MTNLVEIAANDDDASNDPNLVTNRFFASQVRFNAKAGVDYAIALDGFGGDAGYFVLAGQFEVTTDLYPVITNQPLSQVASLGTNVIFTVGVTETNLDFQWYLNGSPLAGQTGNQLARTNIGAADVGLYSVRVTNPVTARYTDSVKAALEISSDPDQGIVFQDKVELFVTSSAQPAIRPVKPIHNHLSPADVPFGGFYSVGAGVVGYQLGNNVLGSRDLGETNHAGLIGRASLWLCLVTTNAGALAVDTRGSQIDTVFAVYQALSNSFSFTSNNLLGYATNAANPTNVNSVLVTNGPAGRAYMVVVDGLRDQVGVLRIDWTFGTLPQPSNPATASPPPDRRLAKGSSYTLRFGTASVTNAAPAPLYFWYRDGQLVAETPAPVLVLTNIETGSSGTYSVVASNALGLSTNLIGRVLALQPPGLEPGSSRYHDGIFEFVLTGTEGESVVLEATTDLGAPWDVLLDTDLSSYKTSFQDNAADAFPSRFYRLVPSYRIRSVVRTTDGSLQMSFPTGHDPAAVLEASSNLVDWVAVQTNSAYTGTGFYTEPNPASQPRRFYRSRPGQ